MFDLFVQGERTWNAPKEVLGSVSHWSSAWLSSTEAESAPPAKGPGRGSVFTVTLPRIPMPQVSQPQIQVGHHDVSSQRVLIIEDNRDAREMFWIMLELSGHKVIELPRKVSRAWSC